MKKLFYLVLASLLFSTISHAQNSLNTNKVGVLNFETEVIDYGIVGQNSNGIRYFTFTNTGNAPIIISKVKASCTPYHHKNNKE